MMNMAQAETMTYRNDILKELFARKMDQAKKSGKKIVLISEEILTSRTKTRDMGVVAKRIQEAFSPTKIIFSIRNQLDLLKSMYLGSDRFLKNVPEEYRALTIPFEASLEISYKNHLQSCFSQADFHKTIDYYAKLFEKKNIYIHLFEEFIIDKPNSIKRLTDFLGIDGNEALTLIAGKHENKGVSQAQLDHDNLQSRFFPYHRTMPVRLFLKLYNHVNCHLKKQRKAAVPCSPEWESKIWNYYSKSNRMLSEEFTIPLDQYGYPL